MTLKLIRHVSADAGREPRVLTIGKFDGIHRGHAAILARVAELAQQAGLRSSVLTFEPHPRDFFSAADRAGAVVPRVANLRDTVSLLQQRRIDELLVQRFDAAFAATGGEEFIRELLVERLSVKHLLVGENFRFGRGRQGGIAELRDAGQRYGFEVETLPMLRDGDLRVSSSAVRAALGAGDLAEASRLLGRNWAVSGRLVAQSTLREQTEQGVLMARFLGARYTPLPSGVYAVRVRSQACPSLPGALLIDRPTPRSAPNVHVVMPATAISCSRPVHVKLECLDVASPQVLSVPMRRTAEPVRTTIYPIHSFNPFERCDYA